ncbi:MAG: DNA primase [Desulfovibrio sp.]|jgi:putative DNA primase/helicase|nr:DNA primase [Desulfovibrio sp.]
MTDDAGEKKQGAPGPGESSLPDAAEIDAIRREVGSRIVEEEAKADEGKSTAKSKAPPGAKNRATAYPKQKDGPKGKAESGGEAPPGGGGFQAKPGPGKDSGEGKSKNIFLKDGRIAHPFIIASCYALDKGIGALFATMMRDKFVYVPEKKLWYAWEGHYWKEVFESIVRASVERVVERLDFAKSYESGILKEINPEDNEAQGFHKRNLAKISNRINVLHEPKGVTSCLRFALDADDPLIVSSKDMDKAPMRLVCEDGMIDMRTSELTPGRQADYITRICPVRWKGPDAPAPNWERMLFEILGEQPEVLHYFHKLIGYAMAGKVTEKLFVILLGEDGDSGKTTIFETLYEIVRDYCSPMPVELLLEQGGAAQNPNAPTPAVMALSGLRLTWASEPGENRRFSVDRIKLMSGNDSLVGRNPWDITQTKFPPTHTLFLLTNHKMRAAASDQAFWGRVRLIECPYSFVAVPKRPHERKRNISLKDEIVAEEGPGVLAWIARGYQLYLEEGLVPPDIVRDATALYQREEDYIAEWIEECIDRVADDNAYETMSDMYDVYRNWFIHGYGKRNLVSQIKFGKLAAKVIRKAKVGGQVRFYAVRLKDDARERFADK